MLHGLNNELVRAKIYPKPHCSIAMIYSWSSIRLILGTLNDKKMKIRKWQKRKQKNILDIFFICELNA